jgi:FHA domain
MNVTNGRHRPGLWFVPGDAVLARMGGLVLLSSVTENDFLEKLLDGLASINGDGPDFARLAEAGIEDDGAWQAGAQGPAVVAVGPSRAGLAVTVSGTAWVEVTTGHGVQRLEAGQPSALLRCVVRAPVIAVHGGLGTDSGRARPDPFSRLDAGTVRACGFTYRPGEFSDHPGQPATGEQPDPVAMIGEPAADEATPAGYGATPAGYGAAPAGDGAAPAGDGAAPAGDGAAPAGDGAAPAGAEVAQHACTPDAPAMASEPFEAVLLVGTPPEGIEARPALPMPAADPGGHAATDGPIVSGVYCKNGHFDDPQARYCAICGISMNQLTLVPQLGQRPPLGMLVLDDGAIFQLDRDYVIGRDPALDASVAVGKALPLRATDDGGTVSRTHARIQLDGWLVLVTDLGSTNGTRIRLPGQAADQALTPRVPAALVPGSLIDLGGRQIRYESHRGR